MEEIELKFLEVNVPIMVRRLLAIGAKKTFDGEINSYSYDFADKRLSESGELFRLRRRGTVNELTYKQKMENKKAKAVMETQVTVDDFESMRKIISYLGMHEKSNVKKRRVSYSLGDIHFEFDTFTNVPTFLEIEAPSMEKLKSAVHRIGLSLKDGKAWTGKDVLKYYGLVK
jgi:adenylate cyclase class 2